MLRAGRACFSRYVQLEMVMQKARNRGGGRCRAPLPSRVTPPLPLQAPASPASGTQRTPTLTSK